MKGASRDGGAFFGGTGMTMVGLSAVGATVLTLT